MKKMMMVAAIAVSINAGTCEKLYELAGIIMKQRQNGASIVDMMRTANEAGPLAPMMRTMVTLAYKVPYYETSEFKRSAIKEFSERYYLECVDQGIDNESKN